MYVLYLTRRQQCQLINALAQVRSKTKQQTQDKYKHNLSIQSTMPPQPGTPTVPFQTSPTASSSTTSPTTTPTPIHPPRRLLIFQETRNPQNPSELVYIPVNKQGLPITGPGPELPSILELPLRILRAFTEIFNMPRYSGWYVTFPPIFLFMFLG